VGLLPFCHTMLKWLIVKLCAVRRINKIKFFEQLGSICSMYSTMYADFRQPRGCLKG